MRRRVKNLLECQIMWGLTSLLRKSPKLSYEGAKRTKAGLFLICMRQYVRDKSYVIIILSRMSCT